MRKKKLFQNKIAVKKSSMHGYGVFAEKNFKKGEKIEECYIIAGKGGDKALDDYYFDVNGKDAVFLGYGCIYNHADEPNADYTISLSKRIATFTADRPIAKGEEIYVSYGDEWFTSRHRTPKKPKLRKKKL